MIKTKKPDTQFIQGTDRLFARRRPGEVFTLEEIAKECGMTKQNVHAIYKRALYRFTHNLHKMCPDYFESQAGSSGAKEIFSYHRPSQNLKRETSRRKPVTSRIKSSMTLEDVQRTVREMRPERPEIRWDGDPKREKMLRESRRHENFMAAAYPV